MLCHVSLLFDSVTSHYSSLPLPHLSPSPSTLLASHSLPIHSSPFLRSPTNLYSIALLHSYPFSFAANSNRSTPHRIKFTYPLSHHAIFFEPPSSVLHLLFSTSPAHSPVPLPPFAVIVLQFL